MSDDIVDLDLLFGTRQVKLGGKVWKLPADIPVPLMLKIKHLADQTVDDALIQEFYDDALGLFRMHHPDLESLPIGVTQLLALIPAVYNPKRPAEGDADPPPSPVGTKTSRRRPAAKKSPSSSS